MVTQIQLADYEQVSQTVSNLILTALEEKPDLTLCMASGHSPARTCDLLADTLKGRNLSGLQLIGLDEWLGMSPDNEGSCRYFFENRLTGPLNLQPYQCHFFDGLTKDPDAEVRRMDALVTRKGIDLAVVGIGMNGHIGFNEPGTPFNIGCHVAVLDDTTKTVGQKYFSSYTELEKGITVGLGHLMNASHLVVMADGTRKAGVIRKALEGPVDPSFPASIVQVHRHATIVIDRAAGSELTRS